MLWERHRVVREEREREREKAEGASEVGDLWRELLDDRVCAAAKAGAIFAAIRPERAGLPGRHKREVPFFFSLGLCVCVL